MKFHQAFFLHQFFLHLFTSTFLLNLESLKDFNLYLKNEKRYSIHTEKAYMSDLNQFVSYLKESYELQDQNKATSQMVRSWVIELMNNNTTARSINRKLSTLKSYFKFLLREGVIVDNPMKKVSAPKMESRLPSYMEKDDMDLLLDPERFENNFSGMRNRLMIMLLYYTGMRRSELIGLTLSSFDVHNNNLKVLGKGNKERIIPINNELSEILAFYLVERNNRHSNTLNKELLLTDSGKMLYPNFVYRIVKNHLAKVSTAEKRSPHVLRHTFATHLLNNGADLNAIKEILGHANLSATQIYTHNSVEKLKQIYNQAHPKA